MRREEWTVRDLLDEEVMDGMDRGLRLLASRVAERIEDRREFRVEFDHVVYKALAEHLRSLGYPPE